MAVQVTAADAMANNIVTDSAEELQRTVPEQKPGQVIKSPRLTSNRIAPRREFLVA